VPPPSTRGPSASIPVPPPSTRGPSARALTRQAIEASQQPMLQQRAREAAGYDLPNSSDEDEEPYEEPVEVETRKRTIGKPGWEVQHQHDRISISALHSLLKRQGTYADTTAVENSQHMKNLRVHSVTVVTIQVDDPPRTGGKYKRVRRNKTLILYVTRNSESSKACMESLRLANSKERSVSDQFELVKLFAEGEDHSGSLKKTVDEYIKTHNYDRAAPQYGSLDIDAVQEHIDDVIVEEH